MQCNAPGPKNYDPHVHESDEKQEIAHPEFSQDCARGIVLHRSLITRVRAVTSKLGMVPNREYHSHLPVGSGFSSCPRTTACHWRLPLGGLRRRPIKTVIYWVLSPHQALLQALHLR